MQLFIIILILVVLSLIGAAWTILSNRERQEKKPTLSKSVNMLLDADFKERRGEL